MVDPLKVMGLRLALAMYTESNLNMVVGKHGKCGLFVHNAPQVDPVAKLFGLALDESHYSGENYDATDFAGYELSQKDDAIEQLRTILERYCPSAKVYESRPFTVDRHHRLPKE
ncbi:hypothetical protein JXC34_00065 [Candidatus Woesearchaeota archaeon]|nr:hypothetical protein [Candidatus Woesearchaeota archaeon]